MYNFFISICNFFYFGFISDLDNLRTNSFSPFSDSNPNDSLLFQISQPPKPLTPDYTSENTSFTTSANKDPLRVRLGKRDEIKELVRDMLKNLESAGKNKFEKTAPKRDNSRTYLNGVDITNEGKLAKYGGLVRPKNNSRVDRKLNIYVSRKFRLNLNRDARKPVFGVSDQV